MIAGKRPIRAASQTLPMNADDERLGQLLKALRVELGLTQEQVATATSLPVRDIHRVESGRVAEVAYGRIRRLFAEVEARTRIVAWWRGAAADRLLDERHASLAERGSRTIARYGWATPTELSFSEFGERGSIDIFAHRAERKAVAVCEVKSAFGSLEDMNRTLDAKVRLAPTICRKRLGWSPARIGRILLVPDESTIRRIVAAHRQTFDELYPARSREIRRWLRDPAEDIGGIWFLSDPRNAPMGPDGKAETAVNSNVTSGSDTSKSTSGGNKD
jgi:transcriptional regulator with XRE-family HTH domain